MEFIDLKQQQARIKSALDARLAAVLAHGQYIMGPEVRELEEKLAAFTGAAHCLSCASGTNALELVLAAWGIGKGDAVFTTPLSFIATAETIARTGATPVFVDIDQRTFNMDPTRLASAIQAVTERDSSPHPLPRQAMKRRLMPRALVVVDLFGNPAAYDTLLPLAKEHNLLVLEDSAQGFGSTYKGRKLCNCGCHAAATSFFPAKPLGCYGDGGAVFTNDASLAALVDSLRYHGRINAQNKNDNVRLGCNGRLDTLQAAILLAKMDIFAEEVNLRREVGAHYGQLLQNCETLDLLSPVLEQDVTSVWAQYTVQLPRGVRRGAVMKALKEQGIPTAINYPKGMHTQGCLAHLGYAPHHFPTTQDVCERVLSLPMHPYLKPEEQRAIVDALRRACGV